MVKPTWKNCEVLNVSNLFFLKLVLLFELKLSRSDLLRVTDLARRANLLMPSHKRNVTHAHTHQHQHRHHCHHHCRHHITKQEKELVEVVDERAV